MQYHWTTFLYYRTSTMDGDSFAARLTALASAKGLDATALSRASGLKEGAIYKLLRGDQRTTSIQTGLRLADALSVDPWYLAFGRERGATQTTPGVSFYAPADAVDRRELPSGQSALQGDDDWLTRPLPPALAERLQREIERALAPILQQVQDAIGQVEALRQAGALQAKSSPAKSSKEDRPA